MKNLLVFASGDKEGGGSGFQKLAEAAKGRFLRANIVGVVSNHADGGVHKHAQEFGIPFFYFPGPYTAENYQRYVAETKADFIALSGWVMYGRGLPPDRTINIHPGPLPRFGGLGMYGHHVHEAVLAAFKRGEITHTEMCMHFVIESKDGDKEKGYDKGPVFFRCGVELLPDDTAKTIAVRVNKAEHEFQWHFTNKVVLGEINWDGKDPASLKGGISWRRSPVKL